MSFLPQGLGQKLQGLGQKAQGYFGAGEEPQSYEQMKRQRALAELMAQRVAGSQPQNWAQGLQAVTGAFAAKRLGDRADTTATAGREKAQSSLQELLQGRLGGSGSAPAMPLAGPQQAPTQPQGPSIAPDGSIIRQGLIERGLPEHVADAFVMNFQDESGLNPGINEQNPLVEGSRGGFGLAQWTGPRRRALEAYAQQRGANVADPNVQMDFLMMELQGPESGAAQAILGAQDTGSAAAAIVNKFLRPAEEHRSRREQKYLGKAAPSGGQGDVSFASQQGGIDPRLMDLMADPYTAELAPMQQSALASLFQQQLQGPEQMSPYQQAQLQMAQEKHALEMAQAQTPEPVKPMEINGQLVNPMTGQVLGDYRTPEGEGGQMPAEIQALQWRAEQAGLQPGTQEYQDFIMNGGNRGTGVPAGFAALDAQAKAAGLEPGSPEYQDFMLGAGAGERARATAIGKAGGEAVVDLPNALGKAERAIANLEAVRNDPALPSITGMLQGRMPPMNQAGTDLMVRIDQAKGQAFLEAFDSLKGAGQITEVEGLKAERAIARLNRAQSTEAYQQALDDLAGVLRAGMDRARQRAGAAPAAPMQPQAPVPAAPAAPMVDFSGMSKADLSKIDLSTLSAEQLQAYLAATE